MDYNINNLIRDEFKKDLEAWSGPTHKLKENLEEELEAIEREEWLTKFDDYHVMNAARMFLEWIYHLPDDWKPQEYTEFTF